MAGRTVLVATLLEDAVLDQPLQPRLQHVASDPEVGLELVEAMHAEQGFADDQQRPALSDDLERRGDAAHLVLVGPLQRHRGHNLDD